MVEKVCWEILSDGALRKEKIYRSVCAVPKVPIANEQQQGQGYKGTAVTANISIHVTTQQEVLRLHMNARRQAHIHTCTHVRPQKHTRFQSAGEIRWTNRTDQVLGKQRRSASDGKGHKVMKTQRRAHEGTKYETWNRRGVKINGWRN